MNTEAGFKPPSVKQVTFHTGSISRARFAPDGSIIYAASWGAREGELFTLYREVPDSRPLGITGSVHAISRNGELAVSLAIRSEGGFVSVGTLARVPLPGGTPRPVASDVYEADWSPDGKQLAVARRAEDGFRIEYPIGRTLYESNGWFSHLRFSPAGDRLAFLEHPIFGDNLGHVRVIDLAGHSMQLTEKLYVAWGLAWGAKGGGEQRVPGLAFCYCLRPVVRLTGSTGSKSQDLAPFANFNSAGGSPSSTSMAMTSGRFAQLVN